ncbi:F0F1 ATP synthase subunit delta [Tuanshanicoccus lijuaniae]|uniref:F0F1 ATP synthase subunit delta n=1 Tax=Aerococcaceae bacterium zg-1292 TaxID=2774330 RepID=UPI0019379493|nr:F0F1 ATP synthase subunit delta [Aerococcaceae bacterium zg-1292]MBS4456040.1 F0F1 ATP synthase subunit delta [Aerococcaceae bacterium zg-A91]MBS4457792.1 F0F1 ATP synthase subunit delta [Aerococcaceae bacterium zg-BR33]QQA37689.1 F0F1 ATP synthase subunit delta [Aerococcaceae bacterium zg-1292]
MTEKQSRAENTRGERVKTHEDTLLKKIQQEKMRESLDSLGNKDDNREHYEDMLLEKLMTNLTGSESSIAYQPSDRPEMLMITSAVELTDDEKEAIVRKFMEKTNKTLRRITTVVDSNLITGIRLQSESFYYEVSGQKTLRELRRHLDRNWRY